MLPSGHSRTGRSGTVTPAMFPAEYFDLYPAARSRMALVRGPSGHPGRLPGADCPPGASRPTGLRRSFLRDPGGWVMAVHGRTGDDRQCLPHGECRSTLAQRTPSPHRVVLPCYSTDVL